MKKNTLPKLLLLSFSLSVAYPSVALPEMGGPTITTQQEAQIGKKIYQDLIRYNIISEDIAVNTYLNQLGQNLSQGIPNSPFAMTLFGVEDNTINAFAMPGGYIGVNRGLIINTQSESELASVIGHEMAHVTQRHLARMQDNTLANNLLIAAGVLAAAAAAAGGNGEAAQGLLIAAGASQVARQLAYTRDYEREADRVGIQYLANAGFDPYAMPTFFGRLQRANQYSNSSNYPFLLTHPLTTERIAESQSAARTYPVKMKADSLDYLLIREHLRVDALGSEQAARYYPNALTSKQYLSEGAQHYGWAKTLFLRGEYKQARQELAIAQNQLGNHPLLIHLAATIAQKENTFSQANTLYQQGLNQFPQNKLLIYGQLDALLNSGQTLQARKLIQAQINKDKRNADLYKLLAKTYAEQNLYAYTALGDAFYYQGLYQAALEKYEQALKTDTKNQQENFYLKSQIEAKVAQIKKTKTEK